ncbi:MAG: WD40 repeat domain-containing protein [Clostridiales bacterium]|nr:WD40 repeat domain-containing protein [Clostridiales bacterium]
MKKHLQVLLSALCVLTVTGLFISGCSTEQNEPKAPEKGSEVIQEVSIRPDEGWVTGDISANGKTAFCLLAQENLMAQDMKAVKLCAYDLESETETVVYEYANEDGFYLNELEAVADGVFWVRTEAGQKSIEKLDLATGEVEVIEQYGQKESDILLQSDGKYLTWYCIADDTASIRGYQIAEKKLFDVSTNVNVAFPFVRANVVDGICSYTVDNGDQIAIQVYDLDSRKVIQEIPLEKGTALFNVTSDRNRCLYSLFREGVMDQKIFVFDYTSGETTMINEDEKLYVFSWSYVDGKLFLNERNSNSILVQDLATEKSQTIKGEKETLYVLGSTTPDGSYLALNAADEAAPVLTLIRG